MKIIKDRQFYGLEDEENNTIVPADYHSVFQISHELYGFRKGIYYGIIKKTGKEVIPCILKGYTEEAFCTFEYQFYMEENPPLLDVKDPFTYKFDGIHYMKKFRCEFVDDIYAKMELEKGEPYVNATDHKGDTFLCDLSGKILSYGEYDKIVPLDMQDFFLVVKEHYGNIWNCRTGKFLLKNFLYDHYFSRDAFNRLIVDDWGKKLMFNPKTYQLECIGNDNFAIDTYLN